MTRTSPPRSTQGPGRALRYAALRYVWIAGVVLCSLGCAGLSDDIRRARRQYAAAAYEDALVWLEAVEDDIPSADMPTQARWYYLRGMTAYRMGQRGDARHYLALAHVTAGERGVGLQPDWQRTLVRTREELQEDEPARAPRPASAGPTRP